jgi:endoglucanase
MSMRGSRPNFFALAFVLVSACAAAGCGDDGSGSTAPIVPVGPEMTGLHVVANHLENAAGDTVVLRGVNRSGTEYQCVHGAGVFDGAWGTAAVAAIASWRANAVRIPLNELCWLSDGGTGSYIRSIKTYVDLLHQFHIVPIVELHWAAPGKATPLGQQPMPNLDHSVDLWTDVGRTFANDDGVVFELYNEPFPDSNKDSTAAWQCWRDGCMAIQSALQTNSTGGQSWRPTSMTYQAVGMQALVDAVRTVAPRNLILAGGIQYSNTLSQWMAYAPVDPSGNLAAAWHIYNFNGCIDASCWDAAPAAIAANLPIVATEIGQRDCQGDFITTLMDWLDGHGASYLAWSWNTGGSCVPATNSTAGRPWTMVQDYNTGAPNGLYAQTFHDHLAAVVAAPAN